MPRSSPAGAESLRVRLVTAGSGNVRVATGLGVLDDLLELVARTARFDLTLEREGEAAQAEVDAVGEALGRALAVALAQPDAVGLGNGLAPADEALASVVVEASGRPLVISNVDLSAEHVGGQRGDLLARFFDALATAAGLTIHVRLLHGEHAENVLDAIGKALGLALAKACRP